MATPIQAAATTVGAGSLAAASGYGISLAINENEEEEIVITKTEEPLNEKPKTIDTFKVDDINSDPYRGKLISLVKSSNLPYLVKPTGNNSFKWWDWAFKNKFNSYQEKEELEDLFAKVTIPFSFQTSEVTALNQACDAAYQLEKTLYKLENSYLLKNISTFCTKEDSFYDVSEPKSTIHDNSFVITEDYKKGVLSIESNRQLLVRKENTNDNEIWWKWAYLNLYKTNTDQKTETFNEISSHYDSLSSNKKALNNACDEAYKKDYSALNNEEQKLLKEISMFCTPTKTQISLKLPEPSLLQTSLLSKSDKDYATNKLILANENKLVDPKKEPDWWNWIFDNNYPEEQKNQLPEPFNNVDKGYEEIVVGVSEGTNPIPLNKACQKAYTQAKDVLEKTTNDNRLIDLVKKLCSPSSIEGNLELPSDEV